MSAALDTVKAFSDTLANELAQAVKEQDAQTVIAFVQITERLAVARQTFLDNLNTIEDAFSADIRKALEARSRSVKENGAQLDAAFGEITEVVNAVKAMYE